MKTGLRLAALLAFGLSTPSWAKAPHPTVNLPDGDDDSDGIPNDIEGAVDTDLDGTPDYRDTDSDEDGLADALEDRDGDGQRQVWETGRVTADTDLDGLVDGDEDVNRNGVVDKDETSPLNPDSDGDWLDDGVDLCPTESGWPPSDSEFPDGCPPKPRAEPPNPDRDGDGITNTAEEASGCLSADSKDTDGDGIPDGKEDRNHNGRFELGEQNPCNPNFSAEGAGCEINATHGGAAVSVWLLVALLLGAAIRRP
jgi:hypothetical protein